MRIPSASTDRKVYFVAVDATDLKTRETGLSSFTVVYSLDGAADVTYTTPTVAEIDATTMPGVYVLTLDEGTTLASGHDTEEYCLHITQASMAPVTRVLEIYRPKFTEGQTATMANSAVDADIERLQGSAIATPTVAGVLEVDVTHLVGVAQSATDLKDFADDGYDPATNKVQGVVLTDTLTTYTGNTVQTGDSFARLGAPAGASVSADVAAVKTDTAAILVDTGTTLDGRIPAALVGGRMDSSVGAMAANVMTAAAAAADLTTELQSGLALEATAQSIKTKTDSLTFTTAGIVDANVQQINDVTITGDGQVGTEFGV